eukprot:350604_1
MDQMIVVAFISLLITSTLCQDCNFTVGVLTAASPPDSSTIWMRNIAAGYQKALYDYHQHTLNAIDYTSSHIATLQSNSSKPCTINMDVRDTYYFPKATVVTEIFDITSSFREQNNINVPIILGPEFSTVVIASYPLASAFNFIQISSGATSTTLSDESYNSFFRTIPNDKIQAKALILLCQHFGWNSIGILYINHDNFIYLQKDIATFGDQYNISTQSFGFVDEDHTTLHHAVDAMKESGLYIFILLLYDYEIIYNETRKADIAGYPYYYIGNEAIFSAGAANGMIGTCPWSASIDDIFAYPYPVNESSVIYKHFYMSWLSEIDSFENYGITNPSVQAVYSYDAATVLIKAIDKYIEVNDIKNMTQYEQMIFNEEEFKNIMKDIWFIGLSGNVSFYENGDRCGALYSFCNVDPETGTLNKVGFMVDDDKNQIQLNDSNIYWPLDFRKNNVIPQSEYREYLGIASFSSLPIVIWCFCGLSMLISVFYVIGLLYYRERNIIRASQWKLNVLMIFGTICTYVTIIIWGIDESFPYNNRDNPDYFNWNILCNARIILLNLSFSFIFTPLLCKMYRIKRIFNFKLEYVHISAERMAIYNLIYVIAEIIVIFIVIFTVPNYRIYTKSIYDTETHFIEYYGSCTAGDYYFIYFIVIFLPKIICIGYCVIISVSVYSTVTMMKFNEGLKIIFCVLLSSLLIAITVIVLYSITINGSSSAMFFYGFLCLMLLVISHFVSAMMLLPRLIAI